MDLESIGEHLESALGQGGRGGFRWFDRTYGQLPPAVWGAMGSDARVAYQEAILSSHLYAHLYCYGELILDLAELPARGGGPLQERDLAQANQGGWVGDPDWVVSEVSADGAVATRNGVKVRFPRSWLQETEGRWQVLYPTAEPKLSPGFFLVRGRKDLESSGSVYRFYLSLTCDGRLACLRHLTTDLNESATPFRFKTISRGSQPNRADSAVSCNVEEAHVPYAAERIAARLPSWRQWIIPMVPSFSKQLAPGVGFAQDPGDGRSFGESRCAAVARSWLDWRQRGCPAGSLARVFRETLEQDGFDPERPHLNLEGRDASLPNAGRRELPDTPATTAAPARINRNALLTVAVAAGDWLVDHAIVDQDRCQWIATRPGATGHPGPSPSLAGTMRPDVYAGLSGIALFLASLHYALGEDRHAEIGCGAANAALDAAGVTPEAGGFYSGTLGAVAAAATVSGLTADAALRDRSTVLLDQYLRVDVDSRGPDLLLGHAGEIIALLKLADALGREDCKPRAAELGWLLVAKAEPLGDGVGWPVDLGKSRFLAGFTHGGAGICYALMRLHQKALGNGAFLETAMSGIVGEDTFFRPLHNNWIDARANTRFERFSSYWCHGLPGILLARSLALELNPTDESLQQCVDTACDELARQVFNAPSNTEDLSLCHGLCGNAEILDILDGGHRADIHSLLADVGTTYGLRISEWPHGLKHGLNPGLMTGFSGIALCFLRMATDDPISVLRP